MKESHCGICEHFIRGKQGLQGACHLVAGTIDPSYWCRLFKKRG